MKKPTKNKPAKKPREWWLIFAPLTGDSISKKYPRSAAKLKGWCEVVKVREVKRGK